MTDDAEPPASKLTRTKERWAQEGRMPVRRPARDGANRLPPGQHAVTDWPVLDLGEQPAVTLEDWRLHVYGAVDAPRILDWPQLMQLPQITAASDIHCVTSWSRFDNQWQGVATADLLAAVRPQAGAAHVLLHSYDGYSTNLALADFAAEGAMLAHAWNGAPLSAAHGGPLRLVVPHLYFWKSAKWIQRIEFRGSDAPGFWEVRGYHNRGDPWLEERYSR